MLINSIVTLEFNVTEVLGLERFPSRALHFCSVYQVSQVQWAEELEDGAGGGLGLR